MLGFELFSDGAGCEGIIVPAGGSVRPASAETVAGRLHTIHMLGSEVYKYATRQMAESAVAALRKAGLSVDDVDQFVFHQANLRDHQERREAAQHPGGEGLRQHREVRQHVRRLRADGPGRRRSPPAASSRATGS